MKKSKILNGGEKLNNYVNLAFYPTPIHKLNNINKMFPGYEVYIKRDDQTGLALGGNKVRKLEYLMKDALDKGFNSVVTFGGMQSNHCRQTAAAAAVLGLKCFLILRGPEPEVSNGNYLLDKLLNAEILWCNSDEKFLDPEKLMSQYDYGNDKPYLIPMGGSNYLGSFGYARAMEEFKNQSEVIGDFDYIFFASCSGGTHSGMAIGKKIFDIETKIIGINIDKVEDNNFSLHNHIVNISNEALSKIDDEVRIENHEIILDSNYSEAGYGVITENEIETIKLIASTEGILLDPIYTSRAFFGMLDYLKKKKLPENSKILFWHTGGAPSNFYFLNKLV